ncbi:organ-specific protein P4-like [Bidens hawaiensis]|uniref:organ-specific protein P4-like n=1 Tax=Bidens hawaiensis TaxID=980011 RepID=UPI004049E7E0
MRSLFAVVFLFSLLLLASVNDARTGPEEYWRSVMKDEPMPKALQDVLIQDPSNGDKENKKDRFIRNFDTKPNLIIYRSHVMYNQKDHELASSKLN